MMTRAGSRTDTFQYLGARSLMLLHEQELRHFVATWRTARDAGIALTGYKDPNYESLNTLLTHVLWWARDYMVWACESLGRPDPEIGEVPPPDAIVAELDTYLEHLLGRWRAPLSGIPEELFFRPQHTTRWGSDLPVEALLEHAVVHPMRHRLQLLELLERVDHR